MRRTRARSLVVPRPVVLRPVVLRLVVPHLVVLRLVVPHLVVLRLVVPHLEVLRVGPRPGVARRAAHPVVLLLVAVRVVAVARVRCPRSVACPS